MTRLLIVDDSALMRKQMRRIFEAEPGFELETCKNGAEALERLEEFRPDVIALDVNMPVMDGLTALSHIMLKRPTPVVMVSSLTQKGAMATLEALALGAVDFVSKPGGTISLSIEAMQKEIVAKVRAAVGTRVRGRSSLVERLRAERRSIQRQSVADAEAVPSREGVVLIGVSTGGPRTLEDILPQLPADFPWPVVVAQHMPGSFTGPFASRMGQLCALPVMEVTRPTPLKPGAIYIAHGGADLTFSRRLDNIQLMSRPESPDHIWHPSVDLMVSSALERFPPARLIGVLLTGMGYDGAESMARLHDLGGRTIAEAEESCAVFGMPAELIARRGATVVLPCEAVAGKLQEWVGRMNTRHQPDEV